MKKRITLSVLIALAASGCAAHPTMQTQEPAPLTQASLWLNHSAAVAAHSLKNLDQITEVHLTNPAVRVTHVSRVSGLTDHLHLHWSGPVNRLMAQLAQHIGWRYALTIHPHPMPDVAIWNQNAPLPVIVHEINQQMVHVATLRLLPLGRTLVLEPYQAQWLPEHPVLTHKKPVYFGPMVPACHPNKKTSVPATLGKQGKIMASSHLLTVGKHGSLHPLPEGPHGPNIPLQKALAHHWKLLMPWHPTSAEDQIAQQWMAAGGMLYRP